MHSIQSANMIYFQSVRKSLAILGINLGHSSTINQLNGKTLISFFILGSDIFSHFVYLFNEAGSFRDYTDSIYLTTANLAIAICFTILVFQMKNIIELIDGVQKVVDNSE